MVAVVLVASGERQRRDDMTLIAVKMQTRCTRFLRVVYASVEFCECVGAPT